MSDRRVIVVGAINQDVVARVARHPSPGETVVTEEVEISNGGKGANQAFAAATAGARIRSKMIAAVGDDAAGLAALQALESAGVDVSLVRTVVGVPTGRAYITVDGEGENSIVVALGANRFVSPSSIPPTIKADVIVAQTEIGTAPVEALARLAAQVGARFILNDGPVVDLSAVALRAADPLIVNEIEAASLSAGATDDPATLASRLRDSLESRSVIVTLGARGSVVADKDGIRFHEAAPVTEVVDTTGAGDVFVGTVAAILAEGGDIDSAIDRGAAAAALAVTWPGARSPLPSKLGVEFQTERRSEVL